MIDDIKADAKDRMEKSLTALEAAFARIRTGRAHPNILDEIIVEYYGADTRSHRSPISRSRMHVRCPSHRSKRTCSR